MRDGGDPTHERHRCGGRWGGVHGVQVGSDRDQVGIRLRAEGQLEALVELVELESSLPRGLAQHFGHLVTIRIRDAHPAQVARSVPPLQIAHVENPTETLTITWHVAAARS
jgi:hypothetical protein